MSRATNNAAYYVHPIRKPEESIEVLFDAYIEGEPENLSDKDTALAKISGRLDYLVSEGKVGNSDLADYELAAKEAGFWAGFKAALSLLKVPR